MVSDSTLQLTVMKLPLVKFGCCVKEQYPQSFVKAIDNIASFSNNITVTLDLLHVLQPNNTLPLTECREQI